jgi:hypothetical protein
MRNLTEFLNRKTRRLVAIKWTIEGYENYCVASDNKCYSRVTGWEMPQHLKGYTRGYYLNGKFCSLKKLRPLLKLVSD